MSDSPPINVHKGAIVGSIGAHCITYFHQSPPTVAAAELYGLKPDVSSWTCQEVAIWLDEIGAPPDGAVPWLEEHGFDGAALLVMTEQDWKSAGYNRLGNLAKLRSQLVLLRAHQAEFERQNPKSNKRVPRSASEEASAQSCEDQLRDMNLRDGTEDFGPRFRGSSNCNG